jgi:hypothetical protein
MLCERVEGRVLLGRQRHLDDAKSCDLDDSDIFFVLLIRLMISAYPVELPFVTASTILTLILIIRLCSLTLLAWSSHVHQLFEKLQYIWLY